MSKFKRNNSKKLKNKTVKNSGNEEDIFVFLEDNNENIHKNTDANDDIIIVKKKLSKKVRAAIIIPSVLIGLLAMGFITIMLMASSGKKSLYKKADSKAPDFSQVETEDESRVFIDIDNWDNNSDESPDIKDNVETDNKKDYSFVNKIVLDTEDNNSDSSGDGNKYVSYKGNKYIYNSDILTFLVLGIDKKKKVEKAPNYVSGGQSDSIFLVVLNPRTKKVNIISVPRDTYTKIWIYNKAGEYQGITYAQLTLQHAYGDGLKLSNERAKKAVEYLFYNLPIHSVSSVNMGAVSQINDFVGSIKLKSLYTFTDNGYLFKKGEYVELKGELAYEYIHFRDTSRHYTAQERLERQKQYLNIFINKTINMLKANPLKAIELVDIINDYLITDLERDEIVYLATELGKYSIGGFYTVEGTVSTEKKYEEFIVDEEALVELIFDVFYEKRN